MVATVAIGLLGYGDVARKIHLETLRRLPGIRVAAIAEADPRRRAELRRSMPSVAIRSDYREVIASSAVDAAVICLPPALHAEAAIAALTAGKHVYLEKPLATSPDDGRRVVEAWRSSNLVGMIGFNYRFNPFYQSARKAILGGRLGALVAARSAFSSPVRPLPAWKECRASGGGALLDLGSHHLDLARFLFRQPVVEVSAMVRSVKSEDDTAAVTLRLEDGTLIQSVFSLAAVDEDRFEVYGQAGALSLDRYRSLAVSVRGPTLHLDMLRRGLDAARLFARAPGRLRRLFQPSHEPSYARAMARFAWAVRSGSPGVPDLADGLRCLEIVAAAEQSARSGRAVKLHAEHDDGPSTRR